MKRNIDRLILVAAMLWGAQAAAQVQQDARLAVPEEGADLILNNGRIKTTSGWAEAVAIHGDVIVAVGDAKAVDGMRGRATRVVDLGGDTVLPGLHDVHVHPLFAGLRERECRIEQGSSLAQVQERVRACVAKADPGAWITGGQWDASAIGQVPTRAMLDTVAPDNPVLLEDTSGHSAWANSRAIAIAGLNRATKDPEGGIIERDASGEPTGALREPGAMDLVKTHVPVPTDEQVRTALEWSINEMLSHGITSYTEASLGFPAGLDKEARAYAALADSGVLKQRVRLCMTWAPGNEAAEAMIASRNLYARDLVSLDCVKIFLDGVPTDSHTAAMLEPYADKMEGRDDEASRTGILLVKQDVLDEAVSRFDRMGLAVKFHAAGDAAVRAGLDAIEAARKANGFSGVLHDVGHCTFVAPKDMQRARAIGATYEVSPYLWGPTPINDDITRAVGEPRIGRVWPVREMIESGALVVPGSDWAVVPSVNPWIGLETLVTREKPGGSNRAFGKAQAITLAQAMDMYTVNAARHVGMANRVGRIEPGMLADLIVIDQNPFEVPVNQVHETRVRMSFVGGSKVYDASARPADWSLPR